MSTSITSPITVADPTFTGVSKFATGLQQVLSRAVGIASLPLNSLQAGLTNLNEHQAALQNLDATFSNLQQSINNLQSTVDSGVLSARISNGSVVSATVGNTAIAGSYSIEVDDLGSWSTALSVPGSTPVTDPSKGGITNAPSLNLSIGTGPGTIPTLITPASSSLQDLASAINSQPGGQVQATVVNVGSTASPDYRLALTAYKLSPDVIDLVDSNGADLISTSTAGNPATYRIDGTPLISSDSRTVKLAPGVALNLLGQSTSGQPTIVAVQPNPAALASAFSSFASAYNSAVNALRQQHGQAAGVLQGDSLLAALQNTLSRLATYTNGTAAGSLANFGIKVDQTGRLSVDTSAFTLAANQSFSTLLSTVGTSATGGFLKTAADLLNRIENATTGSLPSEESTVSSQIAAQNAKIAEAQATVTQLQTNLTAQISRADAAIAALESRVSYVTGLFATYTGANNTQSNGLQTL